ncbi:MAG: selenocysteine-specific translation elongation factor [Anaerolineaceae bacterium]|nr:selenocysteine-specific translation elongation factor [Anaerolineaceae bacterium]
MHIIGTAGHVDHGKSTLVRYLTGIDPDRLIEEKKRQLTIDLGFAWFDLPDGERIGVVDVPGHRDFIENMLAGVGGIDLGLLVIAADEGVMPQTTEHLQILDLLGVENLIVALTKIDLVPDEEWLHLVIADVSDHLAQSRFAGIPICPISAYTGEGVDALIETMSHALAAMPPRLNINQPVLPIDRVFSIDGFGTVVTGTLSRGQLHVGDQIEVQPARKSGRVRGLQSYHEQVETAYPGSRVAVNISGLSKQDLQRGDVLSLPGKLGESDMIDCWYTHLPDVPWPLRHNSEVKFFCGAAEAKARVRLLANEQIVPGESGWLQLVLDQPLAMSAKDRFILRSPSPAQTIGGGLVINPQPAHRWKRFQADVINQLEIQLAGSPEDILVEAASDKEPLSLDALQTKTQLDAETLNMALQTAIESERIIAFDDVRFWSSSAYFGLLQNVHSELEKYHQKYPLRLGMPREALRQKVNVSAQTFNGFLHQNGDIATEQDLVRLASHTITFTHQQEQAIKTLIGLFESNPTMPPSIQDASAVVGEEVLYALVEKGTLVLIPPQIVFLTDTYHDMVRTTIECIQSEGRTDAKDLRDVLRSSRKYVIAFLEHLDSQGITKRVDDNRILGPNAAPYIDSHVS